MSISLKNNSLLEKTSKLFQKWPLYILLLPIFFILHGVRENFGFVLFNDVFPLFLVYAGFILFFFFVLYLIFRKPTKAGLLTMLLFSIFFFYGAIQDFLKLHLPQLNRYVVLFPFFLLLIIITSIFLKKSNKGFEKVSQFLNLLLLLLIVYDFSAVIAKTVNPAKDKFSVYAFDKNEDFKPCGDCAKPDIYFLLFDEYASSSCLKTYLGFDNSHIDSFLLKEGFQIQKKSSGNYNFTPFSMASILNMSYIEGINSKEVDINDYARCNKLIKENEVIKLLANYGYDIVNYSIFALAGNPSPIEQDFLPLKTNLISSRTLWGRIQKDILWNLFIGKFEMKWLTDNAVFVYLKNNNRLIDLVKQESFKKNKKPRFIYAHYNLPHPPYYFDKNGKLKDKEVIKTDDNNKESYLDNVNYTNTKIEDLINTIQTNSNGKAVIIVMGDHGYRHDQNFPHAAFLENMNAVYLPDRNYNLFYDSITGVNQFRVLTNTLFKQNLPLLKDSTTFLKDK